MSNSSKTPSKSQQPSQEVSLSNDLQKMNTKTKKETNQIETKDSENEDPENEDPENEDAEDEDAEDEDAENEDPENDDELMCDNEIFGDILTKIKDFVDKTNGKKCEKNYLTEAWQIFNDLLNRMKKHEDLTDENISAVRKGVDLFADVMSNLDSSDVLNADLVYAKEIFYMYFNLINLPGIQDYLKNVEMHDDLKIIYRICTTEIMRMIYYIQGEVDLGVNERQRPANCIELLSIMQNYVKTDLNSSDLAVEALDAEASITRWSILYLFMFYSDKTNMVPDCIEAGWLETLRDGLIMIYK
jgi:hypothetical protein